MSKPIDHPPITPISELDAWGRSLAQAAAEPLEYCKHFPTVARRLEAWWAHECIDRPVFIAKANTNPDRPITRRLDLMDDPDAWFAAKFQDMRAQRYIGDALPSIRVDFGPVLLGGMLGGRIEFGSDTTWTHAFIDDDWSNAPDWELRDDNPWWCKLRELLHRVAADAAGRYLVCTPDLGGSADVLLNLRGSTELCMDVIDKPHVVREAIDAIYPAWNRAFTELYRVTMEHGAALIHWLELWSDRPYMIPACDFNYMIGPDAFDALCLPDITRQAATVGRGVFHLDGPGAANHINSLLEVPDIAAIQITPGEGAPSPLPWIELIRKTQQRGRSVLILSPAKDVLEVCRALRPEGLAFLVLGAGAEEAFEQMCRHYGCATDGE